MTDLRAPDDDGRVPEVALTLPPLVESSFGSYYPSTAVLAAYLSTQGIGALQTDLNEDFALYLLQPEILERLAEGFGPTGQAAGKDAMTAVVARLLLRLQSRLFDTQGRHLFRPGSTEAAYLLAHLAHAFQADVPLSALTSEDCFDGPGGQMYQQFLQRRRYAEGLPASVHTVGISVPMGPQLLPALLLAREIRRHRPDMAILLGGPTLSLLAEVDIARLMHAHPAIDAIIRFDGERPLAALAAAKRVGDWTPAAVPGVSARAGGGGGVVHRPPQPGLPLDQLPYGEYDRRILSRLVDPAVSVVQARGCYWGKCSYCDYVELYKGSPPFRTTTPARFVDEIAHQVRTHGVHRFALVTEALPAPFARRASQLILERGLDVRWHSFAMVDDHFTPELFETMVRAGCEYLVVGMETMNDRLLQLVQKAATRERNRRFVLNARAAELPLKVNVIPDLPSSTQAEAMESLAAFRELEHCYAEVTIFPFEATVSSAIGRAPARFGLEVRTGVGESWHAQFATNHLHAVDPAMTDAQRHQVHAAYHAFADTVNSRRPIRPHVVIADDDAEPETLVRLADELLDLCRVDRGIHCYNWLTRQRFVLGPGWWELLDDIRAIQPLSLIDLTRQFATRAAGPHHVRALISHGMLIVAQPAGPPDDASGWSATYLKDSSGTASSRGRHSPQ